MKNLEHSIWAEKYRPTKIADCILPDTVKNALGGMASQEKLSTHLLLSGPAGGGKTTAAKALCKELDYDFMVINGSNEGRLIDTLRTKITQFASTVSFSGNNKAIILDECLEECERVRVGTVDNYTNISLKDMALGIDYPIVSFNMETGALENDIGRIISGKEDEVFEVTFEDGRTIAVNKKHPFIVKLLDGTFIQKSIEDGLNEDDNIVGI